MSKQRADEKLYYFIDIDTQSRQILSWDVEAKDTVKVDPGDGCHRVFLSKGQYNKLVAKFDATV